ncbi:hypothetical protein HDE_02064 [Halotydeus destructor]|nr:hypothetical protein HDE_02064 [Halotydeus destructor]
MATSNLVTSSLLVLLSVTAISCSLSSEQMNCFLPMLQRCNINPNELLQDLTCCTGLRIQDCFTKEAKNVKACHVYLDSPDIEDTLESLKMRACGQSFKLRTLDNCDLPENQLVAKEVEPVAEVPQKVVKREDTPTAEEGANEITAEITTIAPETATEKKTTDKDPQNQVIITTIGLSVIALLVLILTYYVVQKRRLQARV